MPEGAPVEVRGLVKRYGEIMAVDGVDLTVEPGDVYGYLGPNGAGKTTSLRMMLGLIRPTAGEVRIFGRDPQATVHALDGVAGFVEAPRFYPYLSGMENLRMMAAYDGGDAHERIAPALEMVHLADRAKDRVGGYSHGMRQRLGIAGALLRNPRLMLLDEPTTGLDPGGMRDMRELVRTLAAEGITVVLSSHVLSEVEELCNRLAIVRNGRMVYEGHLSELRRTAGSGYRLRTTDNAVAERVCRAQSSVTNVHAMDGEVRFTAEEPVVGELSVALVESGAAILSLSPEHATLEELFFRITEGDEAANGDERAPVAASEQAS